MTPESRAGACAPRHQAHQLALRRIATRGALGVARGAAASAAAAQQHLRSGSPRLPVVHGPQRTLPVVVRPHRAERAVLQHGRAIQRRARRRPRGEPDHRAALRRMQLHHHGGGGGVVDQAAAVHAHAPHAVHARAVERRAATHASRPTPVLPILESEHDLRKSPCVISPYRRLPTRRFQE